MLALTQAWVGYATFGDVFGINAIIKLGLLDGAGTFEGNLVAVFLVAAPLLLALAWLPGAHPGARGPVRGAVLGLAGGLLMIEVVIAVRPNHFLRAFGAGQLQADTLSGTYYAMAMTILAAVAAFVAGRSAEDEPAPVPRGVPAPRPADPIDIDLGTAIPYDQYGTAATRSTRRWRRMDQRQLAGLAALAAAAAFTGTLWQPWMASATGPDGALAEAGSLFDTPFGPPFLIGGLLMLGLIGAAVGASRGGAWLRSAVLALAGPTILVLLLMLQNPARFILRPLLAEQTDDATLYHPRTGMYLAVLMVVAGCVAAILAHPVRPAHGRPPAGEVEPGPVEASEPVAVDPTEGDPISA